MPEARAVDLELSRFVHDHHRRLIRLAGLVCRNTDDAEDAVQGALERAWRSRGSISDPARLRPWLDRIVVREAIRIDGSHRRRIQWLSSRTPDSAAGDVPDPRGQVGHRLAELGAAFDALSAEQRAVIILHLYAGYTVSETAEMLGVPVETARSRLRLARQRLRHDLGQAG